MLEVAPEVPVLAAQALREAPAGQDGEDGCTSATDGIPQTLDG